MSSTTFSQHVRRLNLVSATIIVAFFCFLSLAHPVEASAKKGYEALMVQTPSSVQLTFAPGERKEIEVAFQNIGEKAWVNDGAGYVSIYTYDPKYRRSAFDPGTWLGPTQVKRLIEPRVEVGEKGTMRFELHAPKEEGEYTETFQLASEDTAWISGGLFTFRVKVVEGIKGVEEQDASGTDLSGLLEEVKPRTGALGYDATVLIRSAKKVVTQGGVPVTYTVGIKNAGTKTWTKRFIRVPDVSLASDTASLAHASWLSSSLLVMATAGEVKPGQLDFLTFTFTAPTTMGEHLVAFQFSADDEVVEGGEVLIPVDVTSNAPDAVASPLRDGVINKAEMVEEPLMRVGILIVDEETNDEVVISCDCDVMAMTDSEGNPLANVVRGGSAKAYVKAGKYFYDVGRGVSGEAGSGSAGESSTYPIRFTPDVKNAVLTIQNFDRRVTRGSANTDNQFRNVLELRYNAKKDRTWMINELPMEMYLRGLAETSNVSPMEYQKTMITAARTYAYYHYQRSTKHASEGFMVDAYVDQVYKGYGQEVRMPRLVQAIDETYGVTVTYDGATAITPYFSRSDGRTRDWSEVWAGNIAWLKGVAVPCDAGKTLWGHGIGISASGAICLANEGMLYKDILKYFYTGVDLRRDWEVM